MYRQFWTSTIHPVLLLQLKWVDRQVHLFLAFIFICQFSLHPLKCFLSKLGIRRTPLDLFWRFGEIPPFFLFFFLERFWKSTKNSIIFCTFAVMNSLVTQKLKKKKKRHLLFPSFSYQQSSLKTQTSSTTKQSINILNFFPHDLVVVFLNHFCVTLYRENTFVVWLTKYSSKFFHVIFGKFPSLPFVYQSMVEISPKMTRESDLGVGWEFDLSEPPNKRLFDIHYWTGTGVYFFGGGGGGGGGVRKMLCGCKNFCMCTQFQNS